MALQRILYPAISICAFLAFGPGAQAGHQAEIQARGKLTMLCFPTTRTVHAFVDLDRLREANTPVSEIRDPTYFAGIEVDLIKHFAQEMGLDLEIRAITTSYADLLQALADGKGDLAASSLTPTEQRETFLDFTIPFSSGWVSVVVPDESKVSKWEDLRGLKGAVMKGSSQLEYLKTHGPEDIEVILTNFTLENLAEVEEGNADFTIIDTTVGVGESPDPASPHLKVAFHLKQFGYAMALPEGSDLRPLLDDFLQRMIDSGEVARLQARYTLESGNKPAP